MNGFLVIDKPGGMTSRDAVNQVQKWFPRKTKIGHTGTLDPLATGVLVICIGAAARLADYVQAMSKSYTSCFRLGAVSTTDDADGEITTQSAFSIPTRDEVERALASFIGTIEQVPPAFSALKVLGRRAHELARKGTDIELKARPVRIDAIRITGYERPYLDVEVDCGKGTYIRSIARDVGAKLGCGGMVQTLRRTRIGEFTATQGIGIEAKPEQLKLLPPIAAVNDLTRLTIDTETEQRFRCGQSIRNSLRDARTTTEIALVNCDGELVAIGECEGGTINPKLVLNR
jgi:tRNA pseudouridine55 synthase